MWLGNRIINVNVKNMSLMGEFCPPDFIGYTPFAPQVLRYALPKPRRGDRCIVKVDPANSKPQRGDR